MTDLLLFPKTGIICFKEGFGYGITFNDSNLRIGEPDLDEYALELFVSYLLKEIFLSIIFGFVYGNYFVFNFKSKIYIFCYYSFFNKSK